MSLPSEANLGGIVYRASESEGLVVFGEDGGVWGIRSRISFERRYGIWYVGIHGTESDVPVSHIIKAYEIVKQTYGGSFEGKNGPDRP